VLLVAGAEPPWTARHNHHNNRFASRLQRRQQILLIWRQRRCRIVAKSLGVRQLANHSNDDIGTICVGDSNVSRGRECHGRVDILDTLDHRRARRNLPRGPLAAVVARCRDALPADTPTTQLTNHRIRIRASHKHPRAGSQRQNVVAVLQQRDRFTSGLQCRITPSLHSGLSSVCVYTRPAAVFHAWLIEQSELELERQDPSHRFIDTGLRDLALLNIHQDIGLPLIRVINPHGRSRSPERPCNR